MDEAIAALVKAVREFRSERTKLLDGLSSFVAVGRAETAMFSALEHLDRIAKRDA